MPVVGLFFNEEGHARVWDRFTRDEWGRLQYSEKVEKGSRHCAGTSET